MRARASGFTLLEILIAVLLLALGIVGGVALQMASLRARHQAALLSQATQLATALAERMRANPGQAAIYLTLNYDAAAEPEPAAPAVLCHDGACNGAQLAQADLYETKLLVRQSLPGGRVLVCRDAGLWSGGKLLWGCAGAAAAPVVVKVGWRGRNPDGTPLDSGRPEVALAAGALP